MQIKRLLLERQLPKEKIYREKEQEQKDLLKAILSQGPIIKLIVTTKLIKV